MAVSSNYTLELPKGSVLPLSKVNPGSWYWKDDSKSLEFVSAFPAIEAKEKTKKGKIIHFQEPGVKNLDRSSPSFFRDIFAIRGSPRDDLLPRPVKRGQNEWITLEDVKYAALFLAHEDENFHISSFSVVMRCKQLDDFLMALLYYISFYLEKIALEKKPKSFMGKPSILERKELMENRMKLAVTKKHLAEMYCILILGLGMSDQHHMACGKKKISATQKDREFFECLYNFCSYLAFVTFRQKNFKEIQQEVGRLLRSNVFNPALREKTQPDLLMNGVEAAKESKKVTFSYRKYVNVRHPAIRSVMDQRSPVLSTLLPKPKDSAQYLFQDHYLRPSKISPTYNIEELPDLFSIVTASKVGIIGAPRNKFNPHTLLPIVMLEDEKEDEEPRASAASLCSPELTSATMRSTQGSVNQACVAVSRATTEGDYPENPQ